MADFNEFAPKLSMAEGGFVDHPDDKGGPTMMGITLNTFRVYFGEDCNVDDLKRMTIGQWFHIMKSGYWDICRADYIENQSIAELIADWVVNSGPKVIKNVQRVLGTTPDGIVGKKTIFAINSSVQAELHKRILEERREFYNRIVARDASQKKFLKGWMNRLDKFKFEA